MSGGEFRTMARLCVKELRDKYGVYNDISIRIMIYLVLPFLSVIATLQENEISRYRKYFVQRRYGAKII